MERLRAVLVVAMELEEDEYPDVRLLPSASDPLVAEVAAGVQRKRLAFLARCFRELGFAPAESRRRASLAYSIYVGWFHQRLTEGRGRRHPARTGRLPARGHRPPHRPHLAKRWAEVVQGLAQD